MSNIGRNFSEAYLMAACEDSTENAVYKVKIIKTIDNYVLVRHENGREEERIPQSELLPIDPAAEVGQPDLNKIISLNEASVLINIQSRYLKGLTFTYLHRSLVSINPNTKTPKTGSFPSNTFQKVHPGLDQIVILAQNSIQHKNQSIILSGQSNSGKTYNFKTLLKTLTNLSPINIKIQSSYNIIKYLTHAGTIYNSNSTRIINFLKLYYEGQIPIGGFFNILNIDKARAVGQNKHEKNFHVFYMLKHYKEDEFVNELFKEVEDFVYLGGKIRETEKKVKKIMKCAEEIGLRTEISYALRVLAGVLGLGNIRFVEEEFEVRIQQECDEVLRIVCKLLGVEGEKMVRFLVGKKSYGDTENYHKLNLEDCINNRDFLAKDLYSKAVLWLTDCINTQIQAKNSKSLKSIILLDLPGSENLKTNSLEQLLINYTNEKLNNFIINQHFSSNSIENPSSLGIAYLDNKPILSLFDDKNYGIFDLLNKSSSSTNFQESFSKSLQEKHTFNEYFEVSQKPLESFIVHHSFNSVEYMVNGMRTRNFYENFHEVKGFYIGIVDENIRKIVDFDEKKGDGMMMVDRCLYEINRVLEELENSNCHIVYCIKPNEEKGDEKFNQRVVLEQVQMFSLLDIVVFYRKVLKKDIPIEKFKQKYLILAYRPKKLRRVVEKFLKTEKIGTENVVVDKKNVSIPKALMGDFKKSYKKMLKKCEKSTKVIQRFWKARICRHKFLKIRKSVIKIQAFYKGRLQYLAYQNQKSRVMNI